MESTRKLVILVGDSMGVSFCSVIEKCDILGHHKVFEDWQVADMGGNKERRVTCRRCGKERYEFKMAFNPTSSFHNYNRGVWHEV